MSRVLKIASRKSALAKLQTYLVLDALKKKFPNIQIELHFREASGDLDLQTPLWKMGTRGVFTQDLTKDLVEKKVDLVIHSWKDLDLEGHSGTTIVGVLDRADQRDVLLWKKSSLSKNFPSELKIQTSSPRREYNLKKFLNNSLPSRYKNSSLIFLPVRGNIQTRIRKWRNSDSDGLVLAKAALDRLLSEDFLNSNELEYQEIRKFLKEILEESIFQVLPLSLSPSAPAQGAIAAEVRTDDEWALGFVRALSKPEVVSAVEEERNTLKRFGGGCHQKIGVSVLYKSYGKILYQKGLTDSGEILEIEEQFSDTFFPPVESVTKAYPVPGEAVKQKRIPLDSSQGFVLSRDGKEDKVILPEELILKDWLVTRGNAFPNLDPSLRHQGIVWTSGLKTWYQLAERDIWVHGSLDALGEEELPKHSIFGMSLDFVKCTHVGSTEIVSGLARILTYRTQPMEDHPDLSEKTHFFWMSASQFDKALSLFPGIRDRFHACGPGITSSHIRKVLGESANLSVFVHYESWLQSLGLKEFKGKELGNQTKKNSP
ncbi:uroporphyrinogen synthase [Leptospira borgpetersenii serovar Hardjo-bovis]|uniref:hydroxymethylbilane synthase n=1 Tax=Leptospira borgpetersenii serovar Hardjo-bovis str. Sponselee TaxID=1303729 RepID=M6BZD2_LEPBO|nr:uroporphyrinogen synthase [Leptospira borgpetersenii]ABJ80352.1 Bifunctional porphobilinogen deaminase/uroporphyrinogen synthase [Leptospira borgpetersenii serovar Hardjo-bovis str. L550]AMX60040.1 uroporphyrinogen synthase [Leptospira borgpetersenii serovar Hardjo]AMX63270.1 uroporphyrinogen synthase [Leptospira borgpetersenii serovar Hardjo]AMX66514.1 uroporphyrinogen synthase [Leptospira borgpetersenii serovar Hardjo]AMX69741.1 uroporphyrinogen synthase [Leptospira borgpetersenii serovar